MTVTALIVASLFIFGACLGSFISVVIYRMHTHKPGILRGRSHCPNCDTQLRTTDLIPLVSYLTLRGKCRYCNTGISYMYPLLEVATGGLSALLYLKFPFVTASTLQFSEVQLGLYLLYLFYTFILVFTFFYDLHYLEVADQIMLPAIVAGLIATLATPFTPHIIDALLGAAIGIAFFGVQILLSRGAWVGAGDLRVGAFMGVILGWQHMIVALFASYILGSVVALFVIAKRKRIKGIKIPFAPLLVTGTFITIFFGGDILSWYLNVFGF